MLLAADVSKLAVIFGDISSASAVLPDCSMKMQCLELQCCLKADVRLLISSTQCLSELEHWRRKSNPTYL